MSPLKGLREADLWDLLRLPILAFSMQASNPVSRLGGLAFLFLSPFSSICILPAASSRLCSCIAVLNRLRISLTTSSSVSTSSRLFSFPRKASRLRCGSLMVAMVLMMISLKTLIFAALSSVILFSIMEFTFCFLSCRSSSATLSHCFLMVWRVGSVVGFSYSKRAC